jgi:hypothetical protein
MTVVLFRTLALTNGVRVLPVRDKTAGTTYEHYTTTTHKGRTVIGPVRHRISKFRQARPAPKASAALDAHYERLAQGQELSAQLWQQEDKVVAEAPRVDLSGIGKRISEAMRVSNPNAFPPSPPRRFARLRDAAARVRGAVTDLDNHKLVQHVAVDVIVWSMAVTTVVLCGKVLAWAL